MELKRGMIVKFRDYIECNIKFRNKNAEERYLKRLDEIEGKIVTIYNVDSQNRNNEPMIEVNEFCGERFPIEYFECVIPTIPIEIPKEYLKNDNIIELRNGERLLYTDGIFCKEFGKFCELEDFSYDLKYTKAPSGGYDIVKIYESINSDIVIWERCK